MGKMRERARGFGVLLSFGFRTAPWQAGLFLICGALMALTGPALSVGAKLLVDAALAGSPRRGLIAAAVLSLTAGAGLIVALYYVDLLFAVVEKAGAALDKRLMALMGGIAGLAHHERPEYLDRLDLLREQRAELAWMTNATAGVLRVAVQLTASAILLARLQPLLLLLPLVGVVSFALGKRARDLQQEALEETTEAERLRKHLFAQATSAAVGKELRVFGLANTLRERHHAAAGAVMGARDRADWRSAGLQAVDALIYGLAYAGAIGLVLARAIRGEASPGDVVLAAGLAAGLNGIVTTAVGYGTHFLSVLRAAQCYLWLEDYARSTRISAVETVPPPARLTGGIELRDVSFHYPGTARPLLDGVSVRLPAGAVVALVGENGAGKTTLVKLLCRFYEPDGGAILVDGVDLRRMPVEEWRARVNAAFQDFSRFEFVVRETVGVGQVADIADATAVRPALARGRGRRHHGGPAQGAGDAIGPGLGGRCGPLRRSVAEVGVEPVDDADRSAAGHLRRADRRPGRPDRARAVRAVRRRRTARGERRRGHRTRVASLLHRPDGRPDRGPRRRPHRGAGQPRGVDAAGRPLRRVVSPPVSGVPIISGRVAKMMGQYIGASIMWHLHQGG